jgi:hypothetical protein
MGLTRNEQERYENCINILIGKMKVKTQEGSLSVCRKTIIKWTNR